jgi:hypothetical protein
MSETSVSNKYEEWWTQLDVRKTWRRNAFLTHTGNRKIFLKDLACIPLTVYIYTILYVYVYMNAYMYMYIYIFVCVCVCTDISKVLSKFFRSLNLLNIWHMCIVNLSNNILLEKPQNKPTIWLLHYFFVSNLNNLTVTFDSWFQFQPGHQVH